MSREAAKRERLPLAMYWGLILKWSLPLLRVSAVAVFFGVAVVYFFRVAFSWNEPCAERTIRVVAFLVQCGGFVIGVKGLIDLRETFGHPTLRSVVFGYFSRFPQRKIKSVNVATGTGSFDVQGSASAEFTHWPASSTPIAERLDMMQIILQKALNNIGQLKGEIRALENSSKQALFEVQTSNQVSNEAVLRKAESAFLGGIAWEICSILLFVVGSAAGALSPEIAGLLGFASPCFPSL